MENGQQKAHPFINKNGDAEQGLTKREYFAGLAMQSSIQYALENDLTDIFSTIASDSVKYADALLKELDRPKSEIR